MKLVLLLGEVGSGKNYQANLLKKDGWLEYSFADGVRDVCWSLINWEPKNEQEYELFKKTSFDIMGQTVSGRDMLINIGDGFRKRYGDKFWIYQLIEKVEKMPVDSKIVIPDCRYTNEILTLSKSDLFSDIRIIFCDYQSDRRVKIDNDSEWLAQELKNAGYIDLDEISLSSIVLMDEMFKNKGEKNEHNA